MAGDIEEFLRRAAQRREGKSAPAPPRQPPRPQPPRPEPRVLEAELIEEIEIVQPDILSGESVEAHVAQHIGSSGFAERLSHLGEDVDTADDRMEAHLHGYFEHDLGQLGAKTSVAEDSTLDDDSPAGMKDEPPSTTDFAKLLANPASLRDAIIVSEIFKRPEDRW
jgi:hypothetical protein